MRIWPSAFSRRIHRRSAFHCAFSIAVLLSGGVAAADEPASPANGTSAFHNLDTDQDGSISLEEYLVNRPGDRGSGGERDEARFRKFDANHDGLISEAEYRDRNGHNWAWWLGGFSIVTFFGSLLAVPLIVARLPEDYFVSQHRPADWLKSPRVRIEWLILKNILGLLLLAAGIAMLVFPGQGVLTIILGLMLMDFPGKTRLLNRLAQRPNVLKSINWMRRKAGKPPMLTVPSCRV
jgi:hypothetical protein